MNQEDWQSAIYLIILISVMAFSFFSRKELNLSKILKYSLAWIGIGLIAIILYSFRFEFNGSKNKIVDQVYQRVASEINPSKPRLNQDNQIVINISQDQHFYLKLLINNVEVLMMVDTGASDLMLSLADAKRIGLDPRALKFNIPYQTANGRSFGARVKLSQVEIAGITFQDVNASINQGDMPVGLLGMSFLRRFSKYEFFQDKLVLTL